MFRKKHLLEIGMDDENFKWQEEKELRIRFDKKYQLSRLELPLYRFRMHDDHITNNLDQMGLYEKQIKIKQA